MARGPLVSRHEYRLECEAPDGGLAPFARFAEEPYAQVVLRALSSTGVRASEGLTFVLSKGAKELARVHVPCQDKLKPETPPPMMQSCLGNMIPFEPDPPKEEEDEDARFKGIAEDLNDPNW